MNQQPDRLSFSAVLGHMARPAPDQPARANVRPAQREDSRARASASPAASSHPTPLSPPAKTRPADQSAAPDARNEEAAP